MARVSLLGAEVGQVGPAECPGRGRSSEAQLVGAGGGGPGGQQEAEQQPAVRGGLADDLASEVLARLVAPQYEEEVPYDEGEAEFGNGHVGGDAKATAAAIMAEAEARARAK